MKKLFYSIITALILAGLSNQAFSYDQVFDSIKLRHGFSYQFGDEVDNRKNNFDIGISFNQKDGAGITFKENGDFNQNGVDNTSKAFFYTQKIKDQEYIVPKGDKTPAISTVSNYYEIKSIPALRKENNLEIIYKMAYWRKTSSGYVGPYHHTEYQPYEITWCGDGTRDEYTEPFGKKPRKIYEQCDPNDITKSGWGNGGCSQECKAVNLTPKINLIKTDNNQSDTDGSIGNDTQTINYNSTATFLLTVKNNGNEDLKNIRIEDPKTSSCAGDIDMKKYGNKNDILEVNESFQITCSKNNVLEDFTNTATVYGVGITSNDGVDSQDNTKVIIDTSTIPSAIKIDKIDANPDDLDGALGNDTQKVSKGNKAIFKIKITNTGSDDLINLSTLDPMTGNCEIQLSELKRGDANAHIYTCEHENVGEDFTNTISVKATGKVSGNEVKDSDSTEIILDATSSTATCSSINVTPTSGNAPLNISAVCAGTNVSSYKIEIKDVLGNIVDSNNSNNANFVLNNSGVYGVSCYVNNKTTTPVSCTQEVTVNSSSENISAIKIDKVDANPDDLDSEIGNDTQKISKGDTSIFQIKITNTGEDDLINVKTLDERTSSCDISLDELKVGDENAHIYTCEHLNVTEDFTNIIGVTAVGKESGETVEDLDDTEIILDEITPPTAACNGLNVNPKVGFGTLDVIASCNGTNVSSYKIEVIDEAGNIVESQNSQNANFTLTDIGLYNASCYINNQIVTPPVCSQGIYLAEVDGPSISIDKIDANPNDLDSDIGNDTQTVLYNSGAIFDITVRNNGTKDLVNVEVTDIESPTCNITLDLNTIGNSDGLFNPGESYTYTCDDSNIITNYTNTAVVTANPTDDLNREVTDEDSTDIIVDNSSLPVCTNLSLSQNYGRSAYTSTFTCTGENATSYKVELSRPDGTKDTFNASTGEFNINSRGDYTAICYIQDDITSTACRKTLSYTSGGGSSSPYCRNIDVSSDSVTCTGNKSDSFKLDCGNGNYPMNSNGTFSRESCNEGFLETDSGYISDFKNQDLRCYSSYKDGLIDQGDSSWESRDACYYDEGDSDGGGGKGGYCGDGAVQRPNSKGQMEQCEPGQLGCNSNCTLNITTYPSNGDLDVYAPDEKYIIGNNMDLYASHSVDKPYIVNNSNSDYDNDYYIDEICAVRKNGNSIVGSPQCSSVGLLIPGQRVNFSGNISFIGDTSRITQSSDDNTIAYTVKHDGQTYEWSTSLTDTFEVTVKKPTVVTTGGGTAYVGDTLGLSDNSRDNNGVVSGDTNITGTSVGSLSSGVKETSESDSSVGIDKNSVDEDSSILNATNAKDAEFVKYNGLENVYYYKGDIEINNSSDLPDYGINENKTYIIDGHLIINTNINSHNANLGFIVIGDNHNLSIHKSVKKLKGTFINVKGYVIGSGGYTTEQIIIKGSMYGKMNKLLEKRTYIKNNDGVIDVGTIVSFGSSVFRKPAPLTSKFIGDYLEAQKTAK